MWNVSFDGCPAAEPLGSFGWSLRVMQPRSPRADNEKDTEAGRPSVRLPHSRCRRRTHPGYAPRIGRIQAPPVRAAPGEISWNRPPRSIKAADSPEKCGPPTFQKRACGYGSLLVFGFPQSALSLLRQDHFSHGLPAPAFRLRQSVSFSGDPFPQASMHGPPCPRGSDPPAYVWCRELPCSVHLN
jgi:hypothetical protein